MKWNANDPCALGTFEQEKINSKFVVFDIEMYTYIHQFNAANVVLRKYNVNSLNARPKSHSSVLAADAVCKSIVQNYKIEYIV